MQSAILFVCLFFQIFVFVFVLFFFLNEFVHVVEPQSAILQYKVFYAQIKWQFHNYWVLTIEN